VLVFAGLELPRGNSAPRSVRNERHHIDAVVFESKLTTNANDKRFSRCKVDEMRGVLKITPYPIIAVSLIA
jgi:hypothetical protein